MTGVFHKGTSASSGAYRDILAHLSAFCTSKVVTAAVKNAGGANYAVGDILSIPHASAYGVALLEVLTLSGSAVATVLVTAQGAYARRLGSAAVHAAGGGANYVVGDVLQVVGGTTSQPAKVKVATLSGSAVATVTVFESGGAYTVDPTTSGCATDSSIGTGVGTGATLDLTMQAIVGTTNIASTAVTGIGSGATFDLTLVQNVYNTLRDWNKFSVNSILDEKEVVLQGSAGGGFDDPIVGFQTYTQTSGITTNHGILCVGMDTFNSGLALSAQNGVGPSTAISASGGVVVLTFDNAQTYWFRTTGRVVEFVVKAVGASTTTYQPGHAGLLNPYGTSREAPYPMYVSGSTSSANRAPDAGGFFVSGFTEVFCDTTATAPAAFRRVSDGTWVDVMNSANGVIQRSNVVFPIGNISISAQQEEAVATTTVFNFNDSASLVTGAAATALVMPSVGANESELYPATVQSGPANPGTASDSETVIRGEIDGVYWVSATKSDGTALVAEDTITVAGVRYIVFQNAHRTERYSYFCLKMG